MTGVPPSGSGSHPSGGAATASPAEPSIPNAWALNLSNGAVELIREVGIYGLGGNDGCPCTNFAVRSVNVDVSCHKSEKSVRVYTHHLDFCDDKCAIDTRLLAPIAEEVLRQVDAYYGADGTYAAEFKVRYCSWSDDHPARGETPNDGSIPSDGGAHG